MIFFSMVTACNFSLQISSKVSWKTLQRVQIEKNEKYEPRKTEVKYVKNVLVRAFYYFLESVSVWNTMNRPHLVIPSFSQGFETVKKAF